MEERNPLNSSHRNTASREGARFPSRERINFDQSARRTFTQMGSTQQNFLRTSNNFSDALSSSTEDLMLNSVNIAIDETGFMATIKTDILQIQDEINKMDVDGTIRGTNPADILKKNHIYAMYKYLSKYSQINLKKFLDSKLTHANQCDLENLLKFMSVRNGSEGLRKLYKLMTVMDVMLVKLTEYQIVSFLKYDKIHESLRQQLNLVGVNKNQSMDTGINISRFQVTQAILDRLFELYDFVGKLQQQGDSKGSFITSTNVNSNLKALRSLEDLAKLLKSGEHLGLPGEIVINLLDLIRKESTSGGKNENSNKGFKETEKELAFQIDKTRMLEKELKSLEDTYNDVLQQLNSKNAEKSRDTASSSSKEYERRIKYYAEQMEALTTEKQRLEASEAKLREENQKLAKTETKAKAEIAELRSKFEGLMSKTNEQSPKNTKTFHPLDNENPEYFINLVKDLEKNYSDKVTQLRNLSDRLEKENENLKAVNEVLKRENDENVAEIANLGAKLSKVHKTKEDTYENALREETEMMKKGFEMKIKKLQDEVLSVKKERSSEIIDLRTELHREKDARDLLLRKMQIYTKT